MIKVNYTLFLEELKNKINNIKIVVESNFINHYVQNSLDIKNIVKGIIYPTSKEEVILIVQLANKHKVPLYPISCGMNLGYGERMPVVDNEIIIDMRHMNKISNYSEEDGTIRIESGVSQLQLYNYIRNHNLPYIMDITGSGENASIVGNVLEGGFGHTPKGYKRDNFSDIEVVLGNGEFLKTGTFPGLGPDMSNLFVQSNFGIITSMQVNLTPKPEHFEAFTIQIDKEEQLYELIDKISILKRREVITGLVHVANSLRTFMTTRKCPNDFLDKVMTTKDAKKLLDYKIMKSGAYLAVGGLYGTKTEVNLKKKSIIKSLSRIGKIKFFNDSKMKMYSKLCNMSLINIVPNGKYLKKMYESFVPTYGLMNGIPTDEIYNNICWKVENIKDLGLIWCSPAIKANKTETQQLISILNRLFAKYQFEIPITLTFVKPGRLIGILNINFNKKDLEQKERAYKLYDEISKEFKEHKIHFYRKPISNMTDLKYEDIGKEKVLKMLKKTFDPNNIISPKRYGIGK